MIGFHLVNVVKQPEEKLLVTNFEFGGSYGTDGRVGGVENVSLHTSFSWCKIEFSREKRFSKSRFANKQVYKTS